MSSAITQEKIVEELQRQSYVPIRRKVSMEWEETVFIAQMQLLTCLHTGITYVCSILHEVVVIIDKWARMTA